MSTDTTTVVGNQYNVFFITFYTVCAFLLLRARHFFRNEVQRARRLVVVAVFVSNMALCMSFTCSVSRLSPFEFYCLLHMVQMEQIHP